MHDHLEPAALRGREVGGEVAQLQRVEVEGGGEAGHAELEEGCGGVRVGDVEREVAVDPRQRRALLGRHRAQAGEQPRRADEERIGAV